MDINSVKEKSKRMKIQPVRQYMIQKESLTNYSLERRYDFKTLFRRYQERLAVYHIAVGEWTPFYYSCKLYNLPNSN